MCPSFGMTIEGHLIDKRCPAFFLASSRIDSPTASHDARRKVRRRGKARVGCGMCEGKVKVEGLKSINRKSPHPPSLPPSPRRYNSVRAIAGDKRTRRQGTRMDGALERRKGPKPQRRLMLFDSWIRDKLRTKRYISVRSIYRSESQLRLTFQTYVMPCERLVYCGYLDL